MIALTDGSVQQALVLSLIFVAFVFTLTNIGPQGTSVRQKRQKARRISP